MATYDNITIHGLNGIVKVYAANCHDVLVEIATDFIDAVRRLEIKVVGVDLKEIQSKGKSIKLVVMFSSLYSLIFNVEHSRKISDAFIKFVEDESICFVAVTDAIKNLTLIYTTSIYDSHGILFRKVDKNLSIPCVLVGDLAVMVLKKPGLNKLSVAEIGGLIGVPYDKKLSNSESEIIHLDLVNPLVFTTEKIVIVISDACACYQMGTKLLSSL